MVAGQACGARQLESGDVVGVAQVATRPRQIERAAAACARAHLAHLARAGVETAAPARQADPDQSRSSAPAPPTHSPLPPQSYVLTPCPIHAPTAAP